MGYLDIIKELEGRYNFLDKLWDDKGRLKHVHSPGSLRAPLRIAMKEWEDHFFQGYGDGYDVYVCHAFTLVTYLHWTGNVESGGWDYCDVYEIACPRARPSNATFGPHKTPGLAKKKALDYLVKHGAIEIIELRDKLCES